MQEQKVLGALQNQASQKASDYGEKIREIVHYLQNGLTGRGKFLVVFILFVSCQGNKQADEKTSYAKNLIGYLKRNDVDSTILAQPFFNERFRSKNNPYNSYVIGLQQMKAYLQHRNEVKINVDDNNSDMYILSTDENNDSNRVFLLVRNDGIESFSPLFKGKEIVGWM